MARLVSEANQALLTDNEDISQAPSNTRPRGVLRAFPTTVKATQILLLLVVLVPVLLVQARAYYDRFQAQRAQEFQANLAMARGVSATFETYLEDVLHQELAIGMSMTSSQFMLPEQSNRLLAQAAGDYPAIGSFSWLDPQGRVLASSAPEAVGSDLSDRQYVQRMVQGEEWIVDDLAPSPSGGEPNFVVSRSIRDETGKLYGIVAATVEPERLDYLFPARRTGQQVIGIIDSQGRAVYRHPNPGLTWEQRDWKRNDILLLRALSGEENINTVRMAADGQDWLVARAPIPTIGWAASASRPEAEAMAPIKNKLFEDIGLLLLAMMVSLPVALAVARYLTVPLGQLREHAMAIGRGELGRQVEIGGPAEMRELAYAFNLMANEIHTREDQSWRLLQENTRQTRLLRDLLDTNPAGVAVVAGTGHEFRLVNPAYRALTPRPEVDPVGRSFVDVWQHAQGFEGLPAALQHVLDTGESLDTENFQVRYPDGTVRYFSSHQRRLLWDGDPAVLIVTWDTTELVLGQRKAEEAMAHIRQLNTDLAMVALQLRSILDEMPLGVVIVDEEARIMIANPQANRLYARAVPYGQSYTSHASLAICYPDGTPYDPRHLPLTRSALDGETHTSVEMIICRPDGGKIPILANTAPVRDPEGRLKGAVGIFQDISQLKELERLKDEFLTVAAHELKTPMVSMKGYAQLLLRRIGQMPDAESWAKPLRTIDSQVNRMTNLVERLLDVSRIQMKRLELKIEPMDLVQLVQEATAEAQVTTSRHHIEVQTEYPQLAGRWDRYRLNQVLSNLLSNAIQYSPDGGNIEVRLARLDNHAMVSVRDEGIGIPPDALAHVFERNYRTAVASRSRVEGMGLGLYIAHEIVAAHGGRMWVESETGKGSWFYFSLPINGRQGDP